jgi:hypothetical protein
MTVASQQNYQMDMVIQTTKSITLRYVYLLSLSSWIYYNVNIIWEIVMEKNGFIFEKERGAAR